MRDNDSPIGVGHDSHGIGSYIRKINQEYQQVTETTEKVFNITEGDVTVNQTNWGPPPRPPERVGGEAEKTIPLSNGGLYSTRFATAEPRFFFPVPVKGGGKRRFLLRVASDGSAEDAVASVGPYPAGPKYSPSNGVMTTPPLLGSSIRHTNIEEGVDIGAVGGVKRKDNGGTKRKVVVQTWFTTLNNPVAVSVDLTQTDASSTSAIETSMSQFIEFEVSSHDPSEYPFFMSKETVRENSQFVGESEPFGLVTQWLQIVRVSVGDGWSIQIPEGGGTIS